MPVRLKPWDAIIIGGGPAGSAAAIALARQRRKVLLFEKEKTAHHKVCGEFISEDAAHYLSAIGIGPARLGADRIGRVQLICGARTAEAPLPFQAFSLSRNVLDEHLLQRAEAEGATIRRGIPASDLSRQETGWRVKAGDKTFLTETAFLATGKHNLRNWPRQPGVQNDMIGLKMHFRPDPGQRKNLSGSVRIFLFDGGYAGLEPIEDGLVNLCLVVQKSLYNFHDNDWTKFLDGLLAQSSCLAACLAGAKPVWNRPLAIFGIPYGFLYQGESLPGLYRLGDQMAVIPSFCGDGISIALHTAHMAARHYQTGNSASYHAQARAELGPQIRKAIRLLQWGTSSGLMQKSLHLACRINPGLLTMTARITRLGRNDASFAEVETGAGM